MNLAHRPAAILCGVCEEEIEHCEGFYHLDWMHSKSKLEKALDGHLASPRRVPY